MLPRSTGKSVPVRGRVSTDTTKLLAVSLFVLCVFVCGVFVGVNFFELQEAKRSHHHHSNAHGPLPPGVMDREKFAGLYTKSSKSLQQPQEAKSNSQQQSQGTTISLPHVRSTSSQSNQLLPNAPASSLELSNGCCTGVEVACKACQANEDLMYYCSHHPEVDCSEIPSVFLSHTASVHHNGPSGLDAARLTFSSWIYLRDTQLNGMRTIVANRRAGCDKSQARQGFVFYVNSPHTNDGTLNVAWSSEQGMCETVSSKAGTVKAKRWMHVGFVLEQGESDFRASLYLNGLQVGSRTSKPRRTLAPEGASLRIGLTVDGGNSLNGAIREVVLYRGAFATALMWPSPTTPPRDGPPNLLKPAAVMYLPLSTKSVGIADLASSPIGKVAYEAEFRGVASVAPAATKGGILSKINSLVTSVTGTSEPHLRGALDSDGELVREYKKDLIEGNIDSISNPDILAKSDAMGRKNAQVVKQAMQHAYGNYEKYAFGHDEVTPRSGNPKDPWGYHAVTLVDSLDTLWLMGMKDEFFRARDYVRDHLSFDLNKYVSVFETNIRDLGGLLSAYEFSRDRAFLDKARDLADRLTGAFETKLGLPKAQVNLHTKVAKNGWARSVLLAEIGTMQIEFRNLAYHTGEKKYAELVEKVYPVLRGQPTTDGLLPLYFNADTGRQENRHITFGAMGDSYYEYLLKVFLQGGKSEPELYADYRAAMDGMVKHLIQYTGKSGLAYVADMINGQLKHKMDHLACFVPGMLALGAYHFPDSPTAERDLKLAKQLAYTCYQMYERFDVGLSPEYVNFNVKGKDFDVPSNVAFYILRPETVESLFILHQITKHPIYREWGAKIMTSLDKYCRSTYGYGAHPDVRNTKRIPDDKMESFFLAETLKYLYLLQSPDHPIDLKTFVFNTEAHPTRIFPDGWRGKLNNGIPA